MFDLSLNIVFRMRRLNTAIAKDNENSYAQFDAYEPLLPEHMSGHPKILLLLTTKRRPRRFGSVGTHECKAASEAAAAEVS